MNGFITDMAAAMGVRTTPSILTAVEDFGVNPGHLGMQIFVPEGLQQGAPLVTILHGCKQDPEDYALGSGWPTLAQRHGFALLFPTQSRLNNPLRCFNWFDPEASQNEVASILAMIGHAVDSHSLDAGRVFVTGLSAGGALTAALLAASPGSFAGGGIIAGMPFGAAAGGMEALNEMRDPTPATPVEWGDKVRAASDFSGRRPIVTIWQGTADTTVNPANADALEAQWADVMGLDAGRVTTERFGIDHCRVWTDAKGEVRLRRWHIEGLEHGTPISPNAVDEPRRLGQKARFMLESRLSSTWLLARDWSLVPAERTGARWSGPLQATLCPTRWRRPG